MLVSESAGVVPGAYFQLQKNNRMQIVAKDPAELARIKAELSENKFLQEIMGIEGVILFYPEVRMRILNTLQRFNKDQIGILDMVKWMIQNDLIVFWFGKNMCMYSLQEFYAVCRNCEDTGFWFSQAQRRVIMGWVMGELISRGDHVIE